MGAVRVTVRAIAGLAGVALLSGCASSGSLSDYQACLRNPTGYASVRRATVNRRLVSVSFDGYQSSSDDAVSVTETRANCAITVRVEGPGIAFTAGPFQRVDRYAFAPEGPHLALVASRDGHRSEVVLDGRTMGTYDDVWWQPTFELNWRHLGWVARDRGEDVVVVDGRERYRAPRLSRSFFRVLDGGGFFVVREDRDGVRAVVNGEVGPRYAEIFERLSVSESGRRYAYVARSGVGAVVVVDGVVHASPGFPQGAEVIFSRDEQRYGYVLERIVSMPDAEGRSVPPYGVVVDGRFTPVRERPQLRFATSGQPVLVTGGDRGPTRIEVLEVETPAVAPTRDGYEGRPRYAGGMDAVRVVIGGSEGPLFDSIEQGSLEVMPGGHVRYRGERQGSVHTVVDNVLQEQGQQGVQAAQ